MQLVDRLRARRLMKAVDVLRDNGQKFSHVLQTRKRLMATVRFRVRVHKLFTIEIKKFFWKSFKIRMRYELLRR